MWLKEIKRPNWQDWWDWDLRKGEDDSRFLAALSSLEQRMEGRRSGMMSCPPPFLWWVLRLSSLAGVEGRNGISSCRGCW